MAEPTVKRYPIRGLLWGVLMGIGLAVTAIGMKWAAIGTNAPFVFFAIGVVVSLAWSMFGPPKGPKGPAASGSATEPGPPADQAPTAEADAEVGEAEADEDTAAATASAAGGEEQGVDTPG